MSMFRKRLAIIGLALTAGFAVSGPAPAQYGACGEERDVPTGTLDEMTYNRMNKAYELIGEEQYDEAYEVFVTVRNRAKGDYLKAVLAQAMAQVEWARGNYDEARDHLEQAMERARSLSDPRTEAIWCIELAELENLAGREGTARARADRAIALLEQVGDQRNLAKVRDLVASWEG